MQIWIRNDCEAAGIDEDKLQRRMASVLGALGCEEAELSVWLCDDDAIRELHRQYFDIDSATNVISFALREGEFGELDPDTLGDVVVSVETARRDAAEAETSLEDEITFLLIHGILHLLGYDHEGDQSHRAPEMEAREAELLRTALDET